MYVFSCAMVSCINTDKQFRYLLLSLFVSLSSLGFSACNKLRAMSSMGSTTPCQCRKTPTTSCINFACTSTSSFLIFGSATHYYFWPQTKVLQSDESSCDFLGMGCWNHFQATRTQLGKPSLHVHLLHLKLSVMLRNLLPFQSACMFSFFSIRASMVCRALSFTHKFTTKPLTTTVKMILLFWYIHSSSTHLVR